MFHKLNFGKHFNNVNNFYRTHGKRFLGHLDNTYRTGKEIYKIIEPALQHVAPETTGHTNRHLNKMDSNYNHIFFCLKKKSFQRKLTIKQNTTSMTYLEN